MLNRHLVLAAACVTACAAPTPPPGGPGGLLPDRSPPTRREGPAPPMAFGAVATPAEDVAGTPEVFAQSNDTLFRLDPVTKEVGMVGRFSGCEDEEVLDIALDAESNMFASAVTHDRSNGSLWRVDRRTAACTRVARILAPTSLSFVPKGTADPEREALVGYLDNNDYVRFDTTTGEMTVLGNLGPAGFHSSGDLVSVRGGGTYLTVIGERCFDCLVEVDPRTGALTKNWGSIGHTRVFGIAYWGGRVYGFDDAGALFEVRFDADGRGVSSVDLPGRGPGIAFAGAGTTTIAPLSPVTK